jgi:iron complex transport system substrate-binding protein
MLERLGIEVVTLAPATTLADVRANIRKVAAHLGVPGKGEAMIADFDARLDALRNRLRSYGLGALVYGAGGYSAGAPSLFHSLLRHLGMGNVASSLGTGEWVSMSIEAVLRADADVLILGEYRHDAPSQASARLKHPALMDVGRRVKPIRVPTRLWNCGTPAVALAGERIVAQVEAQMLASAGAKSGNGAE